MVARLFKFYVFMCASTPNALGVQNSQNYIILLLSYFLHIAWMKSVRLIRVFFPFEGCTDFLNKIFPSVHDKNERKRKNWIELRWSGSIGLKCPEVVIQRNWTRAKFQSDTKPRDIFFFIKFQIAVHMKWIRSLRTPYFSSSTVWLKTKW